MFTDALTLPGTKSSCMAKRINKIECEKDSLLAITYAWLTVDSYDGVSTCDGITQIQQGCFQQNQCIVSQLCCGECKLGQQYTVDIEYICLSSKHLSFLNTNVNLTMWSL